MSERDVMEYDVVTVGAGPAGLAFAIRLKQLKPELSVCVIEKASSVGAHSLSGAVIEPGPLDVLLPGWRDNPPPICVPATQDEFWFLSITGGFKSPITPPPMHNKGNFIVSLGPPARGWHRRPKHWVSKSIRASPPPNPCSTLMAAWPVCALATWVSARMDNLKTATRKASTSVRVSPCLVKVRAPPCQTTDPALQAGCRLRSAELLDWHQGTLAGSRRAPEPRQDRAFTRLARRFANLRRQLHVPPRWWPHCDWLRLRSGLSRPPLSALRSLSTVEASPDGQAVAGRRHDSVGGCPCNHDGRLAKRSEGGNAGRHPDRL